MLDDSTYEAAFFLVLSRSACDAFTVTGLQPLSFMDRYKEKDKNRIGRLKLNVSC